MTSRQDDALLLAWRAAVDEARRAEQVLADAVEAYARGAGPLPTEAQVQAVQLARAQAGRRLDQAMHQLRASSAGAAEPAANGSNPGA